MNDERLIMAQPAGGQEVITIETENVINQHY
jgi:hypothetical protein